MKLTADQLNCATFVGIDAHPDSHTALAINRFKEPKGYLTFTNTIAGITKFQAWLTGLAAQQEAIIIGVEGGSPHEPLYSKASSAGIVSFLRSTLSIPNTNAALAHEEIKLIWLMPS